MNGCLIQRRIRLSDLVRGQDRKFLCLGAMHWYIGKIVSWGTGSCILWINYGILFLWVDEPVMAIQKKATRKYAFSRLSCRTLGSMTISHRNWSSEQWQQGRQIHGTKSLLKYLRMNKPPPNPSPENSKFPTRLQRVQSPQTALQPLQHFPNLCEDNHPTHNHHASNDGK